MKDATPPAPYFDGTQECRQNPELFFPPAHESHKVTALAKAICARCPFRDPCAEYAITTNSVGVRYLAGIWGGLSEQDRDRLRRKRRAA